MHAWEAIQKTLDHIEENIGEEIKIEELAEIAALSLFYYQRLFTRLVKKPVREYIKLRRLSRVCKALGDKQNRILDVALDYGFSSHETFTRAFKEVYGITPELYRKNRVNLLSFDKPDLLLSYVLIDEGVPLISEGVVLEFNFRRVSEPVRFLGVQKIIPFESGKMRGEKTGIDRVSAIWENFFKHRIDIPRIPDGRTIGVCYHGDAPDGYTTFFAGAEVPPEAENANFEEWIFPMREYAVCGFEAENPEQLTGYAFNNAMKYTRFWLRKHGLIADGFFPEIYYSTAPDLAYMELWIPYRQRT